MTVCKYVKIVRFEDELNSVVIVILTASITGKTLVRNKFTVNYNN